MENVRKRDGKAERKQKRDGFEMDPKLLEGQLCYDQIDAKDNLMCTHCGKTWGKACILKSLEVSSNCPNGRKYVSVRWLIKNIILADILTEKKQNENLGMEFKCEKHESELDFYCEKCNKYEGKEGVNENHQDIGLKPASNDFEKLKELMEKFYQSSETTISNLSSTHENLSKLKFDLENDFDTLSLNVDQIIQFFQNIRTKNTEKYRKIAEEIDNFLTIKTNLENEKSAIKKSIESKENSKEWIDEMSNKCLSQIDQLDTIENSISEKVKEFTTLKEEKVEKIIIFDKIPREFWHKTSKDRKGESNDSKYSLNILIQNLNEDHPIIKI